MSAMFAPRTLRPVARVLVVAWLLALAVSWANACIAAPVAGANGAVHHAALAATGADPSWTDGDGPTHGAAPAACQAFCHHAQNAVAKSPLPDLGDPGWAVAVTAPLWVSWPPAADAAAGPPRAAPPPPALPVRIVFLRLNR